MVEQDLGKITSPEHNLTGCFHPVLGHDGCVLAEFYIPEKLLKQALIVPQNKQVPPHLQNTNVVTYQAPIGFQVTEVTISEGHVEQRRLLFASIAIRSTDDESGEPTHISHIVCEL